MRRLLRAVGCAGLWMIAIVAASAGSGADAPAPADAATPPGSQPASRAVPAVRCPVTNQPVDWECVARFRGRWVYFANAEARRKFLADPYEHADGVRAQWDANRPLRVQVRCPVTGDPVDAAIFAGEGVHAVYFASEDARRKWLDDRAPFQPRLEAECYTFQTGCALCGMAINPRAQRELDGQTLYFCCDGCAVRSAQEPAACVQRAAGQARANEATWKQRAADRRTAEAGKDAAPGAP